MLTTTQPWCSGRRALGKLPQGKNLHSCFIQDPNTPKPSPHPMAGACFPLDLAGTFFKDHSSSLIDLPSFSHFDFPSKLWDCNSSSLTQCSCFSPNFLPLPTFLNTHGAKFPGRGMQTETGQSPIFLGSYLNNSCTGKKKPKNQQISLS